MFNKIINKYFSHKVSKRILILSLVLAILVGGFDLFVNGTINLIVPNQEVYSHFDEIALKIIERQNFAFLERSDVLKDYSVTTTSNNTFAITLYGHNYEASEMIFSVEDYRLISYRRFHEETTLMLMFIACCILVYCVSGVILAIIFNTIVILLKILSEIFTLKEDTELSS